MPYSVVGAPALGFDLARLTGGRMVASVLRSALAAGAEDLERLAAVHPGGAARAEWRHATDRAQAGLSPMNDVLPFAGVAVERAAVGETALLRRLETSLLGDSHALDRFVRGDVLDWTWVRSGSMAVQDPVAADAADVLVDAAVAAYLRDGLPDHVRRAMAAPFLRTGLLRAGEAASLTGVAGVDHRLEVLAGADTDVRRTWRAVVDELRAHTGQWAPAMHQATWALSMAERLRLACDVQLAGVIAFERAGFGPRDAAYGVWNALSGVLQAAAIGDLLPDEEARVLLRPWSEVYGDRTAFGESAL